MQKQLLEQLLEHAGPVAGTCWNMLEHAGTVAGAVAGTCTSSCWSITYFPRPSALEMKSFANTTPNFNIFIITHYHLLMGGGGGGEREMQGGEGRGERGGEMRRDEGGERR